MQYPTQNYDEQGRRLRQCPARAAETGPSSRKKHHKGGPTKVVRAKPKRIRGLLCISSVAIALLLVCIYNIFWISLELGRRDGKAAGFISGQLDRGQISELETTTDGHNVGEAVAKAPEFACTSPEKAPWEFNGICSGRPHRVSPILLPTSNRTCGFCGGTHSYLRSLRDDLESTFRERCEDMVIYGAALGSNYFIWLTDPTILSPAVKNIVPGGCLFQFVNASGTQQFTSASEGSIILVHVDLSKMPYIAARRNVKVLKFSPLYLFPWARRVIWMDAKLLKAKWMAAIPPDFQRHFGLTVERAGACASLVGLPIHEYTLPRGSSSISLHGHCATIVQSSKKRPDLSDDIHSVTVQCAKYYSLFSAEGRAASQVFHQEPLIDSAFMVFDLRRDACRQFTGDVLCSWLNEVHCGSDRDQVSFSAVLASSGVHCASPPRRNGDRFYADQLYVDEDNVPMVHIASPRCHWYYGGPRCS